MVNSFQELIDAFGGPAKFGRAIGVAPNTAKQMRRRNSLAVTRFPAVVQAAQDRGLTGVTMKRLVELATERKQGVAA
jgi:hypothetical protein